MSLLRYVRRTIYWSEICWIESTILKEIIAKFSECQDLGNNLSVFSSPNITNFGAGDSLPPATMGRPRRSSSNLGGDPRGDTSAPALSTFKSKNRAVAVWEYMGRSPVKQLADVFADLGQICKTSLEAKEGPLAVTKMETNFPYAHMAEPAHHHGGRTGRILCEPRRT